MKLLKFLYLSIPFCIFPIASFLSSWIVFADKNYVYLISGICFSLFCLVYYFEKKEIQISERLNSILSIFLFCILSFFFLVFPVRDLRLGDGALLVENIFLEGNLFRYQLTLDELFSALIHSFLYLQLKEFFPDPRTAYRITSTIAGWIFLLTLFQYTRKKKNSFFQYLIPTTSGGMILFFGYVENYTIPTLLYLLFIIFSIHSIKTQKKNMSALFLPVLIASIAILYHLVSGYLIFPLLYLWWISSEKPKRIQNAILSALLGLVVIVPFFIYFIFFSDVRVDMSQTHIAHPPFYPVTKLISSKHFLEIFSCIFFSCFAPFIFLGFQFFFNQEKFSLLRDKKFLLVILTSLGFIVHGFTFHPLLGFPSDWDVMSFYWVPISFAAMIFYDFSSKDNFKFIPIFLFSFLLLLGNLYAISKTNLKDETNLKNSIETAKYFIELRKNTILQMSPDRKKFFFKTDYFLFKIDRDLERIGEKKLQTEIPKFRKELEENILLLKTDWQKDFIERLTLFNKKYLELIKNK